ncbi:MAG TPA: hypothetical protein VH643_15960 [Gemmataceae bacterium]
MSGAPFAKGPPKPNPKKLGRKPGKDYGTKAHRQHPAPEQIDRKPWYFHQRAGTMGEL